VDECDCAWFQHLKLEYDKLFLLFAYNFNLRHSTKGPKPAPAAATALTGGGAASGGVAGVGAAIAAVTGGGVACGDVPGDGAASWGVTCGAAPKASSPAPAAAGGSKVATPSPRAAVAQHAAAKVGRCRLTVSKPVLKPNRQWFQRLKV